MNYTLWINRFESNRRDRLEPDWDAPLTISDEKREALALTLAQYELGDGGGPCHLIARNAEKFRSSADEVRRVVDLWFREEAEHSRLLGGAVRRLRGRSVTTSFPFRLFCAVRRAGVQFEMLVLLIVEIVSTAYYRVIRRHAGDAPIEQMCRLILHDEAGHIAFHTDRLAARLNRSPGILKRTWFRFLSRCCADFLWLGHGRWLRKIGVERGEFRHLVRSGVRFFQRRLAARITELQPGRPAAAIIQPVS